MRKNNMMQKVVGLVLTFVALLVGHTTALADDVEVSLSEDPEIPEGTAGHWYEIRHRHSQNWI